MTHFSFKTQIQEGLAWNSKNMEIIGLAMTAEDMSSLSDVYQILEEDNTKKTNYVLQFLWRDMTSKFDVIG